MPNIQIFNRYPNFADVTRETKALTRLFAKAGLNEAQINTPFDASTPTIVMRHSAHDLAQALHSLTPPANAAPIYFIGFQSPAHKIQEFLLSRGVASPWLDHIIVLPNTQSLAQHLKIAA